MIREFLVLLCLFFLYASCERGWLITHLDPMYTGCTDSNACNYNQDAVHDNNSCEYIVDCAGECGGLTIEDCTGECGGLAVEDCAGECGGNIGFPEGSCDCQGNIDLGCGCGQGEQIECPDGNFVCDESDCESDSGSEALQIISPNGGENWNMGTSHTIQWQGGNDTQVHLEIWKGSSKYQDIYYYLDNSGNYSWYISPGYPSDSDYRVKVIGWQSGLSDLSNNYFTIQ